MQTYHIHIKGIVQGVGFRPYVCRVAENMDLTGCVSNTNDGVHIAVNADEEKAKDFYQHIIQNPPVNAIITDHSIEEIEKKKYNGFSIIHSITNTEPDLLLTPDIAICETCREEIHDPANRRYGYAFTTCLNCGPRYSIQTALPYDRNNTTMHDLHMCVACDAEYHNINDRRHFSQTNSCWDCEIELHYYEAGGERSEERGVRREDKDIIAIVARDILDGKIVAVKGIGGYLLLCDATNEDAIQTLRDRKQRPAKPLAIMYPTIEMAEDDLELRSFEIHALKSKAAPIVLCKAKNNLRVCHDLIAPGLDKIGMMLPGSPLLELLASALKIPVVATSGNISGSPIIYKDEDALANLFGVADRILTYDREIVAPQDDSVIQFTETGQQIILRRSRGLAPNYYPTPFKDNTEYILAMGAEMKSSFAIRQKNLYISQYLGDQGSVESQESYSKTLAHLKHLLHFEPSVILADKHPSYNVSILGRAIAEEQKLQLIEVQHHEAHFAAVLAENDLMENEEPVLGFIWDGTGYGDDEQIWGGEVFMYRDQEIDRKLHLKYFPQILGDKMSREPRLSALSLLHDMPEFHGMIHGQFTHSEWAYYQKLLKQGDQLQTSSMGRFLDGLAAMLGICTYNSFEGEAAMKLEALARGSVHYSSFSYPMPVISDSIDTGLFLEEMMSDLLHGYSKSWIAGKIFNSLEIMIEEISDRYNARNLAFSGGVFQNALLTDLIIKHLGRRKNLYFHKQLSPNDECISFGQLAAHHMSKSGSKSSLNPSYVFSNTR
ncbi:MAG TPA: carbamoyltransferase HypF [Chitinophagaceae bacterium]|nr:carbamoyltransferase HypF [Chitinophagaceae bacterium]